MGLAMGNVFFVRTVHTYDSYSDFWRLVELSDYPIIDYDAVDIDSDNVYIITPLSAEWETRWTDTVKATIILWDLEWRLKESSYEWPESALTTPRFVNRVWASDRWYAERIGAQYVPLGSHPGLAQRVDSDREWDVATLCYHTHRRRTLFDRLSDHCTLAPNAWGDDRAAILSHSKTMLHVHQHDNVPTCAPLRFALAAAYKLSLISESVIDAGVYGDSVLWAEYDKLIPYTATLVTRHALLLERKATELHDMLCVSNSFRSFVETAL